MSLSLEWPQNVCTFLDHLCLCSVLSGFKFWFTQTWIRVLLFLLQIHSMGNIYQFGTNPVETNHKALNGVNHPTVRSVCLLRSLFHFAANIQGSRECEPWNHWTATAEFHCFGKSNDSDSANIILADLMYFCPDILLDNPVEFSSRIFHFLLVFVLENFFGEWYSILLSAATV